MKVQDQVLKMYQQAIARLEQDKAKPVDEVVAALFQTVKRQQKQLAELTLKVSMLEDHETDIITDDVLNIVAKAKQVH